MKYKLITADEQDDAAFRARLAPLSAEVLPRPRADVTQTVRRPRGRWGVVALAGLTGAAVASGVGWLFSAWPSQWSEWPWSTGSRPLAEATAPTAVRSEWSWSTGSRSPEREIGQVAAAVSETVPAVPKLVLPQLVVADNPHAVEHTDPLPLRPSPDRTGSAEMIELLLRRGNAALAIGDIVAARLLYERAASLGSVVAATSAGKTHDIEFLSRAGVRGVQADQTAAVAWYRQAAGLGDAEARDRLARIGSQERPQGGP